MRGHIGLGELLLLHIRAVGEVLLLFVLDLSLIYLPYAVALRGIDETSAVWRETHVALLLRCVGDALGGLVFGGCHIYVAVHHESHFLGVWREGYLCGSPTAHLAYETWLIIVGGDGDVYLLWLCSLLHGVDFAVVSVAEESVGRGGEESDRILLLMGELNVLAGSDVAMIDVEGSCLLAQVVEALTVGSPYRRAVFALEGSYLLVFPVVEHPDVASDRRSMMFAPLVFISLGVVVEHLSLGVDADVFHRDDGIEFRSSALCAYLVNLREFPAGKEVALSGRHDIGREEHVVVVLEGNRNFALTVGGDACRCASVCRHHIYVKTSFAVGSEGYFLAVRAPDGVGVVSSICGELSGFSARGRNAVDISLVGENDGFAIR